MSSLDTVIPRIVAPGVYLTILEMRGRLIEGGRVFEGGRLYPKVEKFISKIVKIHMISSILVKIIAIFKANYSFMPKIHLFTVSQWLFVSF